MDANTDSQPFGYTFADPFTDDIFNSGSSGPSFHNNTSNNINHTNNHGNPLLSESENQDLVNFFANTDPFLSDPHASFGPHSDNKNGMGHFSQWADFVPPASVHQVSTTVGDQAQLLHGFHTERALPMEPHSAGPYTNTHHGFHSGAELYDHNSQASPFNARSYSVPNMQHNLIMPNPNDPLSDSSTSTLAPSLRTAPMVHTPHGLIHEQLAALLPNHSERGTVDEQIAAHFSQIQPQQLADHFDISKPTLKRSYTYGTDRNFDPSGYVAPSPGIEEGIVRRLTNDMINARHLIEPSNGDQPHSITGHITFDPPNSQPPDSAEQSEEATSDEDSDGRPAKKRRKSKASPEKMSRKNVSNGRNGKHGKPTTMHNANSKRKRSSAMAQKAQRENLTEEQKRNNHIASEQKRRNLIKRGFDDLERLVPDLRNGGLSRSATLNTAADFLEKVVRDNKRYSAMIKGSSG